MSQLEEMAAEVAVLLKEKGQMVAVAESSSGGLMSAALLAVAGASTYYAGGGVIYTMMARRRMLGMTRDDVAGLEPLSEEMVAVFARKTQEAFECTWGLAELGAAGPSGSRYGHPAGLSVIGVAGPVPMTEEVATGSDDREANMWEFTRRGLMLLRRAVEASD